MCYTHAHNVFLVFVFPLIKKTESGFITLTTIATHTVTTLVCHETIISS